MSAHQNENSANPIEVVDVQKLNADRPHDAIRRIPASKAVQTVKCDLLIVGGGTGGVAAALAATRLRNRSIKVCMTEETDWIGGQMTAQGVSALDENYLVETSGACRTYQDVRRSIRKFYSADRKLSDLGASKKYLDPGNCWVTRLAFEPKVCLDVLKKLLEPAESSGTLTTYLRFKPVRVNVHSDKDARKTIKSVSMIDLDSNEIFEFEAKVIIDATELGDLLPLSQVEYDSGSDSASITTEPHAPPTGNPENVQDFVFPFVIEFREGEHHVIKKPKYYDEFTEKGKFSFQGYKMFESVPKKQEDGSEYELLPFWTYRRLIDKTFFDDPNYKYDLAMINWDSNDLRGENIIDKSSTVQSERLAKAKYLSLGFLYWLQTEAQRDDGGRGYPELMLRKDVLGSEDGLSKFPYIRESRRIHPIKRVIEQDIVASANDLPRSTAFEDSVGIGLYPVDIHGEQEVPGAAQQTSPFQIPLTALIPADATNLLPACKNIGVTHITNGAYRLHPIEWAIGEAQGTLAAHVLEEKHEPKAFLKDFKRLRKLQLELVENGAPVFWFDDVDTSDPDFAAVQYLAITKILPGRPEELQFRPNEPITEEEAFNALTKVFQNDQNIQFRQDTSATKAFMQTLCGKRDVFRSLPDDEAAAITRVQFARLLFSYLKASHA